MDCVVNQPRENADVSIVLLDWSCRESFHILDYLADQTADRNRYEILWVEYYDRPAEELTRRIEAARADAADPPVDVYALLNMPRELCYHKHLMLGAGLLLARGRIVCFCDSDAMVRPTFVQSIIEHFEAQPGTVLHLDEVRNNDPSFHPFDGPDFDDVTGFGCINWIDGRPVGLLDESDPLHTRNYGACMAAARDDLIAIGGADMHVDYLGHICGFYEMTWRLVNFGRREVWSDSEWLYHVWHPGQGGDENIAGPHDGLHLSTRALECRESGRVAPFVESPAIAAGRSGEATDSAQVMDKLVDPAWLNEWRLDGLSTVRCKYVVGPKRTGMDERANTASAVGRTVPFPFGRRPSCAARLKLVPVLLGMIRRQLPVKRRAAAWSRPYRGGGRVREWLRKLCALGSFLKRIYAFDKHWVRQCWLALRYAAQSGRNELVLCGAGDAARILRCLSSDAGVTIVRVCPLRPDAPPKPDDIDGTVIVAAFVDIPARLAELQAAGIPRERIITLK